MASDDVEIWTHSGMTLGRNDTVYDDVRGTQARLDDVTSRRRPCAQVVMTSEERTRVVM